MSKPLVSFVVLNWNGIADTPACLDSIKGQTYQPFEIIVVDNGSADGSKDSLRGMSGITLIDLPVNRGFTGGQITAYQQAKGDFIALVNNDAVLAADWLEKLMAAMADGDVAAAGGRAYLWNDHYAAFDTSSPFYSYQIVDPLTGHSWTMMTGRETTPVNSISGAGVVIRRTAIEQAGYFDDRFFAYYEETDLFARFKRLGMRIMYEPRAHTWHKIAASTKAKPFFYLYQMHRNRFLFGIKNIDRPLSRRFVYNYFKEALRGGLALLRNRDIENLARLKAALWNIAYLQAALKARRQVMSLGGSYCETLWNDANPTVSVVIPCYNYADYVREAIKSVLDQSVQPLEVIVINDGSTDGSLGVIQEFTDKIKIINKPNSGVIDTKNMGLNLAQGDWIIFLDADDSLHPDYIKLCLAKARSTGADLVYTNMWFFGNHTGQFRSRPYSRFEIKRGNYIHNSALIRTSLLRRVGGYKLSMKGGFEDWELYLTLSRLKPKAEWIDLALLNYRRHPSSSRDLLAKKQQDDIFQRIHELHPELYTKRYWLLRAIQDARIEVAHAILHFRYRFVKRMNRAVESWVVTRKTRRLLGMIRKRKFNLILQKIRRHADRLKSQGKVK